MFPRPAVAGILQQGFVEARLHVDVPNTLSQQQFAANKAVRQRLVGDNTAMPWYVIVDPSTGRALRETGLSGGGADAWEQLFLRFLRGEPN